MKAGNKKIIYDGINMSVRALTFFIIVGLIIMAALIWYGALKGVASGGAYTAPTPSHGQSYTEMPDRYPHLLVDRELPKKHIPQIARLCRR